MKNRDEPRVDKLVDTTWNELEVAPREVVMHAARQFAEVLSLTDQFQAFEQAYLDFRQDTEAQSAMEEYQQKQSSLKALIMLNAVSEEDRNELKVLYDRFVHQPSVVRFIEAQDKLIELSQQIGDLLSQAIGMDFGSACRTGGCCG